MKNDDVIKILKKIENELSISIEKMNLMMSKADKIIKEDNQFRYSKATGYLRGAMDGCIWENRALNHEIAFVIEGIKNEY